MGGFFIIIGTDAEDVNGRKLSAYIVSKERLKKNVWPLYKGTRNRLSIAPGDRCLLYLAGMGPYAQHFIANLVVGEVRPWTQRRPLDSKMAFEQPETVIIFKDINYFSVPLPVKPLIEGLSFTPKKNPKWGAAFQGGCRRISKEDYRLILDENAQILRSGQVVHKGLT